MVGISLSTVALLTLGILNLAVLAAAQGCANGTIKLSGGEDSLDGRVEVCVGAEWGTVCSELWSVEDAAVVCRQLQLAQYGSAVRNFGGGNGSIHLNRVQCDGSETHLFNCTYVSGAPGCLHSEDAAVVCLSDGCIENSVRLVDGQDDNEGRVQFCHSGTWGEVCISGWDDNDASVVCRQLGYGTIGIGTYIQVSRTRPVFLDGVDCSGSEQQLSECNNVEVAFYQCGGPHLAHVECLQECTDGDVRLLDGSSELNGRVEVCTGGMWETVCSNNWDNTDASVVCGQLGHSEYGLAVDDFEGGSTSTVLDVGCTGSETHLVNCSHGSGSCSSTHAAGVTCYSDKCTDNAIRLTGGSSHIQGKVEFCAGGVWGSICSVPPWTDKEASVVCRQLGYGEGGNASLVMDNEQSRPTFLDSVTCSGTEDNLLDCSGTDIDLYTCGFGIFASVNCPGGSECAEGNVRLTGGPNDHEGKVEVCIGGNWGTICDDFWDDADASVVCKQLQFGSYGVAITELGNETERIVLDDVECTGEEDHLLNCSQKPIGEDHNCSPKEEAGVTCFSDGCTDGDVRLVGENENQGRVQFCHGNVWGEICASNTWKENDASVACKQLGYAGGTVSKPNGVSMSRPTILEDLQCTGTEAQLSDCPNPDVHVYPCNEDTFAGASCFQDNCSTNDVRLAEGRNPSEGRVEVCTGLTWRTVCSDGWDNDDASVVCKQLGYKEGGIAVKRPGFGEGSGFIMMTEVGCTGQESQLVDCPFSNMTDSCKRYNRDDVGVVCITGGVCGDKLSRLVNDDENETSNLVGRVEVCNPESGVWGTVCAYNWDDKDATVLCKELGLSDIGKATLEFGGGVGPIFMEGVACQGNERFISECDTSSADADFDYSCSHLTDAGVRCNETGTSVTTVTPAVTPDPTVVVGPAEGSKKGSDDNTVIIVVSVCVGVFLLLLIVCVVTMTIMLNFMSTSRKIKVLKRQVTTVELLNDQSHGTLRSLPEDPKSPVETDMNQICALTSPTSLTNRYLQTPGSTLPLPGPVAPRLIPPRPPSPITSAYLRKLSSHMLIPSSQIRLLDCIGQGEFGIVYKAHLLKPPQMAMRSNVDPQTVAVKTLKGCYDQNAIHSALEECVKMKSFDHPNVLSLLGVCVDAGPSPYVVMPYMANGSLLELLKMERESLLLSVDAEEEMILEAQKRLLNMCSQIACGMEYLAEKKFVHRDLATRNCMIDSQYVIKVSDFGLSEDIYAKNYFRQDEDTRIKLPIKWMAQESLSDGLFTEKSDVWSFGVTCWEVFSAGKMPYPGIDPSTLIKMLETGDRMEKPTNAACPNAMYDVMRKCWYEKPEQRPSFSELASEIASLLTHLAGYLELETITGILSKAKQVEKRSIKSAYSADFDPALGVGSLSRQDILTPIGIAIHLDPSNDIETGGFSPQMGRRVGSPMAIQGGIAKALDTCSMESVSSCGSEVAAIMSDNIPNGETA